VVEIMENLAFLANASNLVLYLKEYMHFSPSKSANSVTNFMGTSFLLALLGGFLSDAFFTTYQIYLISAVIEFLVNISPPPPFSNNNNILLLVFETYIHNNLFLLAVANMAFLDRLDLYFVSHFF
jgi:sugar phosphate permease